MSPSHSRKSSVETNASSTYNMILEHVLQYPASYEIPLRTMYTLNCTPRAQPLPKDMSRAPSPTDNLDGSSPISGQFAWNDAETTTMNFTSQLMNHIGSLPSQAGSLPPSFIVSFVARCFHPTLALVDFPQALTALDYLRDLEKRRCKEYTAAFDRLGIRLERFNADVEAVAEKYPGIALWAKNMSGKNHKAELYYSHMYMGLRRWIMINELSLQPFNKLNCMGMLNTLLPPQSPSGNGKLPTPLLTSSTLREERDSFFEYIRLVQKGGPAVLRDVIHANKGPGDECGWDFVQRSVDKYLRVAKNMIDDCVSTTGTDDFTPIEEIRKGKKTDSGVSFGSDPRPSTAASAREAPVPAMPADFRPSSRGLSTIERITREFRRMRVKGRLEVEEIVKVDRAAANQAPKAGEIKGKRSVKRAHSLANIGTFAAANRSSTSLAGSRKGSLATPLNSAQMKRHRMLYDAATTN